MILNKFINLRNKKMVLSDDNVDRRIKVQYLQASDKEVIAQIQKRLTNQEALNKDTEKLRTNLKG
jgi:hypothetical protein